MLQVNVKGGTDAGRRIVKQPAADWTHLCGDPAVEVTLPGYWARCPACNRKHP